ncbi:response regulator transcription factor [Halotalea alkalilenta]|nr:response regulator transcription factor [Halotalea alkalilenta]
MNSTKRTAMVVDDHPVVLLAMRGVLQDIGFDRVIEAHDGRQALQLCQENRISFVILDLDMEQFSGLEFLRRLERSRIEELKVLVISCLEENIYAPWVEQLGARGFLSKNSTLDVIREAVLEIVSGVQVFPKLDQGGIGLENLSQLSAREQVVLSMLRKGMRNKEIAGQLFLSEKTVSTYKMNIFQKLGVSSVMEIEDMIRRG